MLIKPFVWCRSRCRRRRGLLKLPNVQVQCERSSIVLIRAVNFTTTLETRRSLRSYNRAFLAPLSSSAPGRPVCYFGVPIQRVFFFCRGKDAQKKPSST